jgi:hypothetical protein
LNQNSALFALVIFQIGSCTFCLEPAWDHNLPISTSHAAGITGMSNSTQSLKVQHLDCGELCYSIYARKSVFTVISFKNNF